jgi:hypothetical protein
MLLSCGVAQAWTYSETIEIRHTASLLSLAASLSVICRIDRNSSTSIVEFELAARSGPAKREGDLRVAITRNEEREFRVTLHNIGPDYDSSRYRARITSSDEMRDLSAALRFDDICIRLDDGSVLTFPPSPPATDT